ncbi:MAG: hypothetical protein LBH19_10375 [Dysgonamonadaceae bacterium]|jgi:hypothetical protein|nr:hypothetical protein [Dysgonamonadaceae bacterium]
MLFSGKISKFSRALFGVMYSDDYLSFITDRQIKEMEYPGYMTVADSNRQMRRDFYFLSSDLKKAVGKAKAKAKTI